ncbi:uncharacterized protein LTR77_005453 [Saxophila tyrrhenica]|uniref:F-box domain-containing protein n=1 Tax=Saxophila tyrrhenica TaxID=1690608 RepID=A0AAV9PBM1_9PEZI|nr:hypothetical protein LTR77_005453 [Saxophila tyrrhenica]
MASSPLLALPAELLDWIADLVEVEDLLDFALVCKRLHYHSRDRLALHDRYHGLCRVNNDRAPSTMPMLLRLAINDPEAAWHVRELDFWGNRKTFVDWKPFDRLENAIEEALEGPRRAGIPNSARERPREDLSDQDQTFWSLGELGKFEEIMKTCLKLSPVATAAWMTELRQGSDRPLKGILIALLPRLRRVNYISWTFPYMTGSKPLAFVGEVIQRIRQLSHAAWPPGFTSLRRIDVADPTPLLPIGTWGSCPRESVAPLFSLPNLKTLNLSNLVGDYDSMAEDEIPLGTSSVEELGLHAGELRGKTLEQFLKAPARLKKLVLDYAQIPPGIHEAIVESHAHALRDINVESMRLEHFRKLENLTGCVLDVEHVLVVEHRGTQTVASVMPFRDSKASKLIKILDLRDFLPPSIKKLRLEMTRNWKFGEKTAEAVLSMVADFVEDPRYSALEEVCIWNFMDEIDHSSTKALPRLLKRGIELHHQPLLLLGEDVIEDRKHEMLHPGITGLGCIETESLGIPDVYVC